MAKKKNKQQPATAAVNTIKAGNTVHPNKQTVKQAVTAKKYTDLLIMGGIAIVVFLFLKNCIDNQFTNWDDPGYIKDNALIKDLSAQGIKNIFSTAVMGNFHPLTILSYAIEYSYVRLDPRLFHIDSLLLHILTTLSLFWFILKLTGKNTVAIITALLFGLHPMHIESVAWVAARKDVLYGFFYIVSCICYLNYTKAAKQGGWSMYALSLIFFTCSILSKPVAVSLPLTLLLVDYFNNRKLYPSQSNTDKPFDISVYVNKIPYLLISIGFGIRSLFDQKDFKALNTLDVHFNILERISLGNYALVSYLIKAVAPYGLSNFYPYPEKVNDALPLYYYIYPLIIIGLLFLVWKFLRKNVPVLFGILFFLVNIALLLQFIPVGGAILADRYTYIPYIGLFFIIGWYVAQLIEQTKQSSTGKIAYAGVLIYIVILGFFSNKRCSVWYDTVSLWQDEVMKHPDVPSAFNNLGFEYFNRGNSVADPNQKKIYFDSSTVYLKEAVRLQPKFVNPYISLGEVERSRGNLAIAKTYYYTALNLSKADETYNAYLGLAIIYCITGQQASMNNINPAPYFDSARYCFQTAIRMKPFFPEAHSNFGNFFDMMHNFDSSYKEYSISIAQNPDMYASYLNRARLLQRHDKCDEAFKDFGKALEVAPDQAEIYYARSYCYQQKGNKRLALQDVEKARSLGFSQIDPAFYQALKTP